MGLVVFVHGFPLCGAMWSGVGLPSGWEGFMPDLPGFGEAAATRPMASIEGMAHWTMSQSWAAGSVLGVGGGHGRVAGSRAKIVVVGLSMGGMVALEMLRRHPTSLAGVVLCGARAGAEDDAGKAAREARARLAEEQGPRGIARAMLPNLFAAALPTVASGERGAGRESVGAERVGAERVGAEPEGGELPGVFGEVERMILATPVATLAGVTRAMAARADAWDVVRGSSVPIACIAGESDRITPIADQRVIAASAPRGRCWAVARAGHLAPMENPGGFSSALAEALAWMMETSRA